MLQAIFTLLSALQLIDLHTHDVATTWYEYVGLPGYRTFNRLADNDPTHLLKQIGWIVGIPDANRFIELCQNCQIHADRIATWTAALAARYPWPTPSPTTHLCAVLTRRGEVLPGEVPFTVRAIFGGLRLLNNPLSALTWVVVVAAVLCVVTVTIVSVIVPIAIRLWRRSTLPLEQFNPVAVLGHTETKEFYLRRWKPEAFDKITSVAGNHFKLAYVRRTLEKITQDLLFSLSQKIRDIGGSLTRNANLGKALHICYPNLSMADKVKLANTSTTNDIGLHLGEDCNRGSLPSYMSYVDFHMSTKALCAAIQSPTIIITHDFVAASNGDVWFDGEATISKFGNFVTFKTDGGTSYNHGYHYWKDEGQCVTERGAFSYYKVGTFGNSIIILAQPMSGRFDPTTDNNLGSSVNRNTSIRLANGVVASLEGDKYVFPSITGDVSIDAETVMRIAFQMCYAVRDGKWLTSLHSIIRARFVADKQAMTHLACVQEIVVQLADRMAVSVGRSWLVDPDQYSGPLRLALRVLLPLYHCLPFTGNSLVESIALRVARLLFGTKPSSRAWSWNIRSLPAYEVLWPQVLAFHAAMKKAPKQPFPNGGQANPAPANPNGSGLPGNGSRKPSRGPGKTSAGPSATPASHVVQKQQLTVPIVPHNSKQPMGHSRVAPSKDKRSGPPKAPRTVQNSLPTTATSHPNPARTSGGPKGGWTVVKGRSSRKGSRRPSAVGPTSARNTAHRANKQRRERSAKSQSPSVVKKTTPVPSARIPRPAGDVLAKGPTTAAIRGMGGALPSTKTN